MVPSQISCFLFAMGFLRQVFSGLRSNRTSMVSGCSAPLLLSSSVLAFFTCNFSSLLAQMVRYSCNLPGFFGPK